MSNVQNVYQNALYVQSAPNLGAIIRSLAKDLETITQEERDAGREPMLTIRSHPAIRLYAEQIYYLVASSKDYFEAHRECEERVKQ